MATNNGVMQTKLQNDGCLEMNILKLSSSLNCAFSVSTRTGRHYVLWFVSRFVAAPAALVMQTADVPLLDTTLTEEQDTRTGQVALEIEGGKTDLLHGESEKKNFGSESIELKMTSSPTNCTTPYEKVKNIYKFFEFTDSEIIENINAGIIPMYAHDIERTFLQAAVIESREDLAIYLIEKGFDVNKTAKDFGNDQGELRSPAILAAQNGQQRILQSLLDTNNVDLTPIDNKSNQYTALHMAILTSKFTIKIIDLLLKYDQKKIFKIIDAQDKKGNTALHYAAERNQVESINLLFSYHANIFISNREKVPAFHLIDNKILFEYLDNQISLVDERMNMKEGASDSKENFYLEFNYNLLASKPSSTADDGSPPQAATEYKSLPSNSSPAGHSSEKPAPKPFAPEISPLVKLAESLNHRELLKHPLIKSFLHLKWYRIYWFFWINFVMYFCFIVTLSIHIYDIASPTNSTHGTGVEESVNDNCARCKSSSVWWWLTLILLLYLSVREVVEMMSLWQYVRQLENWLELALLLLTGYLLWCPTSCEYMRATAAVVILLAYTELVMMMGRHPIFSTYIAMFIQVSRNFICFLFWYSILIVAFGFSFFILFQHCDKPSDGADDSNNECEKNLFLTLGTSVFKTIIMLSGELEATDIEFQFISIASHIIFLLFIFFIAIVLINLLNGLAITDVQVIKEEAEVVCCVAQVQLYATIESTLYSVGHVYGIRDWFGKQILLLSALLPKNHLRVFLNEFNRMEPDVRDSLWLGFMGCASDGSSRGTCCLQSTCMRKSCRWCFVFNKIVSEAREVVTSREEVMARRDELIQREARELKAQQVSQDKMDSILAQLKELRDK